MVMVMVVVDRRALAESSVAREDKFFPNRKLRQTDRCIWLLLLVI